MSDWIRTAERKPEDEQMVLGYYPTEAPGSVESLMYYAEDAPDGPARWVDYCGTKTDEPTHWKPWEPPQ